MKAMPEDELSFVMPALVAGIHVLLCICTKDVDGPAMTG
jgi:hypothetical protein